MNKDDLNTIKMETNTAIVVEDFVLIADAWKDVLHSLGFDTVKVHSCSDRVLQSIKKLNPSVMLIDINLKGSMNGIELTKKILSRFPEMKIIVLTMHDESFFVKASLEAGAIGYVTKNSPMEELRHAIRTVLNGEKYLCEEVIRGGVHC